MREKSIHQQRVEMFMAKAGQLVPKLPTIPDEKTRRLRAKIILEEALETIAGLGFYVTMKDQGTWEQLISIDKCELSPEVSGQPALKPDLVQIVDGCADVRVVTTGTLSACGVADERIQHEVDLNNLSKFGPGGYRREDGKWMKPPTWVPPAIAYLLDEQAKS